MKKTRLLILSLTLLLFLPLGVSAFYAKATDMFYIPKDEVVEGNVYAAGQSITIDGTIKGDVICAGQSVNINGLVEGDVICAAQSININGDVNGNVRVAGNTININQKVGRNVMAFGAAVNLGNKSEVGLDVMVGSASANFMGKVNRDIDGGAAGVNISGFVGGDVKLMLDDREGYKRSVDYKSLTVTDGAYIEGNLVYSSQGEASVSENATVQGEVVHNTPKIKVAKNDKKDFTLIWFWVKIYSILSAVVIGLVLVGLFGKKIINLTDQMMELSWSTLGFGAMALFLTPIVAIILLFTLIGIPLAAILMGVWALLMSLSKVIVAILVGRMLIKKVFKKEEERIWLAMILGIAVSWIIFSIPFLGWLVCLVAMCYGMGGMLVSLKRS